jgi:hypothetical protein
MGFTIIGSNLLCKNNSYATNLIETNMYIPFLFLLLISCDFAQVFMLIPVE